MEAILDLARRYERAGKRLELLHLSDNCIDMLQKGNVIQLEGPESDDGSSHRVIIEGLGGPDEGH
jgi:hypothetical protein